MVASRTFAVTLLLVLGLCLLASWHLESQHVVQKRDSPTQNEAEAGRNSTATEDGAEGEFDPNIRIIITVVVVVLFILFLVVAITMLLPEYLRKPVSANLALASRQTVSGVRHTMVAHDVEMVQHFSHHQSQQDTASSPESGDRGPAASTAQSKEK